MKYLSNIINFLSKSRFFVHKSKVMLYFIICRGFRYMDVLWSDNYPTIKSDCSAALSMSCCTATHRAQRADRWSLRIKASPHEAPLTGIKHNPQELSGPQESPDHPDSGPSESCTPGPRASLRGPEMPWSVEGEDVREACHFDSTPADQRVRCELWNKKINISERCTASFSSQRPGLHARDKRKLYNTWPWCWLYYSTVCQGNAAKYAPLCSSAVLCTDEKAAYICIKHICCSGVLTTKLKAPEGNTSPWLHNISFQHQNCNVFMKHSS